MANDTMQLKTDWNGGAAGKGNIKANFLDTDIAIPKRFGGNGEGAEPREILITSATACFTMVLTGMLEGRKIGVDQLTIDTTSTTSKEDGFNIKHTAQIILSAGATEGDTEAAHRMIEMADKKCDIGNMLRKSGVHIEAEGTVTTA